MVNIKSYQPKWLGAGISLVLMSTFIAPASAQQVIVIDNNNPFGVSQPPAVGSFIYGSPIATPMPVDPSTGLLPRTRTVYPDYYPPVRHYRRFNNPTIINPTIQDSTIVNPVIINNSWRQRPFRGRSRVIITHPW
ncbi:hypothetical protein [Nostoc sp. FACHB-110]|uniref:hypothetical protein n=1 Tax=Nostoc sp. FACHB-110 TaxID=2692834 RepID=UPI00168A2E57|nr:hypothetical protein [Nostoc sp. FACHB-110]MBD2440019.1 hypothetical protein [Nostoc sp. FACHB-110]